MNNWWKLNALNILNQEAMKEKQINLSQSMSIKNNTQYFEDCVTF